MELRFKEELESWNKLGFLNPYDLTEEEVLDLPVRYGTRVVVVKEDGIIVLLNVKYKNMHTLIGGKIEDNESIEEGMVRECLEESGFNLSKVIVLGYIELWRKKYRKFVFGFIAKAVGDPVPLKLTDKEIESGHEIEFYPIEEVIEIIDNDADKSDNLSSIRSLMFLEEAKKHMKYII